MRSPTKEQLKKLERKVSQGYCFVGGCWQPAAIEILIPSGAAYPGWQPVCKGHQAVAEGGNTIYPVRKLEGGKSA